MAASLSGVLRREVGRGLLKGRETKDTLIYRYTSILSLIDVLRRKKLAILNPSSWDDRNDRYFMELYKEHRKAKGIYSLCAAMCPETYHHWRIFTANSSGACMVMKRAPLEAYLRDAAMQIGDPVTAIRYGKVDYFNLEKIRKIDRKDMESLPFVKRYGFSDEREFRIVVETNADQQAAIDIDCPLEWISRVNINPWLPEQLAKSLINTLKEIDGCGNIPIRRSFLTQSTTWKQAGDRAAGKNTGVKRQSKPSSAKAVGKKREGT